MSRHARVLIPFLLTCLLAGCPTEPATDDPGDPPGAPAENDPAYTVTPIRTWNLVGNPATPGHDTLTLEVMAPAEAETIRPWIGGEPGELLNASGDTFTGSMDIAGLAAGEHELLLQADGEDTAFAALPFVRSHPLYILTTIDWDRTDTQDHELAWQDQLHDDHPHLRMTHFVGPYTFTNPDLTGERVTLLVDWLLANRADHDDEIGLHIHPICHFVEAAGLTCLTEPSFAYEDGDTSGLSVYNTAYTQEQFEVLLQKADDLFVEHGLGKPITYRAGGWTADATILMALEAKGYVADTSAVNCACLEEWSDNEGASLWDSLNDTWSEIGATSQPYYPSETDAGVPGEPSIGVLEVPDNACLADYVEAEEMIAVLEANWGGGPLQEPKVWSIGFHNITSGVWGSYRGRIEGALEYADPFLAVEDGGPLVYGVLEEMPLVWPYGDGG